MIDKLGLVIWGCKGGCRVLCDNSVVDVFRQDIRRTLTDVRSFITISQPGVIYYALEFTSDYKVYTQYRSSNDSGNGAFIGVTLFVPHSLRVTGIRQMLADISKEYFRRYMNPLTHSPLPGLYEDISDFSGLLDRFAGTVSPDRRRQFHQSSVQNDKPELLLFDEDCSTVDRYFDSPYRPEFYECQEVMFLPRAVYEHQDSYSVRFLVEPSVIEKVSEPKSLPTLAPSIPGGYGFSLTVLRVNGEDCLRDGAPVPVDKGDTVEIKIEAAHYKPLSMTCPLSRALDEGVIVRSADGGYSFATLFSMEPQTYTIPVVNDDASLPAGELAGHLFLCSRTKEVGLTVNGGSACFELKGAEVENTMELKFSPDGAGSTKYSSGMSPLCPKDVIDSYITVNFRRRHFSFTYRDPRLRPEKITLTVTCPDRTPIDVKIAGAPEGCDLILPAGYSSAGSFRFSAQNFTVSQSGDTCIFTSDAPKDPDKVLRNTLDETVCVRLEGDMDGSGRTVNIGPFETYTIPSGLRPAVTSERFRIEEHGGKYQVVRAIPSGGPSPVYGYGGTGKRTDAPGNRPAVQPVPIEKKPTESGRRPGSRKKDRTPHYKAHLVIQISVCVLLLLLAAGLIYNVVFGGPVRGYCIQFIAAPEDSLCVIESISSDYLSDAECYGRDRNAVRARCLKSDYETLAKSEIVIQFRDDEPFEGSLRSEFPLNPAADTVKVFVKSPGFEAWQRLVKDNPSSIVTYTEEASAHPNYREKIAQLAYEKFVEGQTDLSSIEASFESFKGTRAYEKYLEYSIKLQFTGLMKRLDGLSCGLKDVNAVRNFVKAHPEVGPLNEKKLNAYEAFFKREKNYDAKQFTEEQRYYLEKRPLTVKNSVNFEEMKRVLLVAEGQPYSEKGGK